MNAAVESIDGLSSRLARYLSDEEIRHIRHAYLYSEQAHDGQKRRNWYKNRRKRENKARVASLGLSRSAR